MEYTQHCFQSLHEHAGIDYHHLILDQGSTDGTREWLEDYPYSVLVPEPENVGIHRGLNTLIRIAAEDYQPDVYVKVDPDCELITPDTLRVIGDLALKFGWLLSPTIQGLNHPPATIGTMEFGGHTVDEKATIGGICMAVPAWVFNQWRFDESLPPWGGDDIGLCQWFRGFSGHVGYVRELTANHIDGTTGQYERYPDYRARSLAEGHP